MAWVTRWMKTFWRWWQFAIILYEVPHGHNRLENQEINSTINFLLTLTFRGWILSWSLLSYDCGLHYIQLHVSDLCVDTSPPAIICHNVIFPSCYPNLPYTVPQWVEPGQYKGSNSTAVYYVILRHFLKEHQRYTQVSGIRALHWETVNINLFDGAIPEQQKHHLPTLISRLGLGRTHRIYRLNQNSVLSYSGLNIRTRLLWIWCELWIRHGNLV